MRRRLRLRGRLTLLSAGIVGLVLVLGSLFAYLAVRDALVGQIDNQLRGRAAAFMRRDNGYHSARLDSVQLDFRSAFTLDGELHHPAPADAPMRVGCAGTACFLRI